MEIGIKELLMYLWQLPQNILGLLVILFTKAEYDSGYWKCRGSYFGISLGEYIIFRGSKYFTPDSNSINHERGHQFQSKYLGPLYLILIGLPSATFNLIDRWFHRRWSSDKRIKWYYSLPWEKWADELGGVYRSI